MAFWRHAASFDTDIVKENLEQIEVYPNPIRPAYTGLLTIRGLQADCVIKITDIVGNAVFETTATGGSVQWDLNSFSGQRVRSGVYLIFVTTNDGLETVSYTHLTLPTILLV